MSQTTTPTYSLNTYTLGDNPGLNRLYDNVQAMVPSAGLSLIKMMAWNTIEEFYIQSTARREIVNWQMAVGVNQIDFNPFDETWLVAWVLGVCGLPKYKIVMPAVLMDMQYPASPRFGEAILALKPVDYQADLPVELFTQWFETLLDGTLFRLFMTPAKPYSSPQLAQYHGKRFRHGIAQARAIAQHGFSDGGGRWQFPRQQGFAMGRRKN